MSDDTLVIALLVGACAFLVVVFIIIPALTARQHDPYDPPAPYTPPGESPYDFYITPDKSPEQIAQEKAEREDRERRYREYYNGEHPAYWAQAEMQARAEQGGWRGWGE